MHAAVLSWDAVPGTVGNQSGPGTWTTTGSNWVNGGSVSGWINGSDAWIGSNPKPAGSPGADTLTITSAGISVQNLYFADDTAGAITIGGTGSPGLTITGTLGSSDGNASSIASSVGLVSFTNGLSYGNLTMGGTAKTANAQITIAANTATTGNITIQNGTLVLTGSGSVTGGSLLVTGGTLDLSGMPAGGLTGLTNISISSGGLKVSGSNVPAYTGTFGLTGGALLASGTFAGNLGTGAGTMQINGGVLSGRGTGANSGIYNFTVGGTAGGTIVWGSAYFNSASNTQIFGNTTNGNTTLLNGIELNNASRTISMGINGGPSILTLAGAITNSGTGSLTFAQQNGGAANNTVMVVLTGSSTYSGTTVISGAGARYQLGNGTNTGASLATSAISITTANGAQFAVNVSGTTTLAAPIISTGTNNTSGFANDPNQTVIIGGTTGGFAAGTGTVIFTGSSNYVGGTLIKSGVLQIGNGGTTGFLPTVSTISGSSGTTLVFNRSDSPVVGNAITGSLGLTQSGSGALTLTGTGMTYTGQTTISSGTLQLGNGTTDGAIASSGTVSNSGALVFNAAGSQNISAFITGAGTVSMTGTGTQKLSGSSNYSGATTVSSGTLQLGNPGALGNTSAVTISSGAGLNLSSGAGTTQTVALPTSTVLTLANGSKLIFGVGNGTADQLVLGASSTPVLGGTTTIIVSALTGANVTDYTIISAPNGGLLPGGPGSPSFVLSALPPLTSGSLSFSGTAVKLTFQATTVVYWTGGTSNSWIDYQNFSSDQAGNNPINAMFGSAQDVVFAADSVNGTLGGFTLTTSLGGDVTAKSLLITDSDPVKIQGTNTLTLVNASGTNTGITTGTGAGLVTISANVALAGTPNLTVNNANGMIISGTISGSNGITKSGSGTLTLSGNNTYGSASTITAGTLKVSTDNALGASTTGVTFNPGSGSNAVFQSGTSFTTGAARTFLFSSGTGIIDTQANVLTIGGTMSGSAGFNKIGSGQLIVNGANDLFTGAGTISSGTMTILNPGSLASNGTSSYSIMSGATLELSVTNTQNLQPGTSTGITFTGNGTLLKSGTGTLQLHNQNGGINFGMTGGTIELAAGLTQNGGAGGNGSVNWTNNKAGLQIDAGASFDTWDGNNVSVDALTGSGTLTRLGFSNTGGTIITVGVNNGSGTFNGIINDLYGYNSLVKSGSGTQVFAGNNSYTGPTTVSGGTLKVTNSNGLGFGGPRFSGNPAGSVGVTGATLDISGGVTVNKAVTLTGGSLINSGTGTTSVLDSGIAEINLTAAGSTYSAPVVTITPVGGGSGATATAANATSPQATNLGVSMTAAGSGYTAAPTVAIADSGTGTGSGATATAVLSSLTLSGTNNTIGGAGNLIINAQITGTGGGFSTTGGGTVTLAGSNSYTGATIVTGGNTLLVTGNNSSATGAVQVTGSSTLGGTGSIGGAVTVAGGATAGTQGSINLQDGAIGTLTLGNGLTIGGASGGLTSNLLFDIGNSNPDSIAITGALTLNTGGGIITISQLASTSLANGSYSLLTYSSLTGSASSLTFSNLTNTETLGGKTLTLSGTTGAIVLTISGGAVTPTTYSLSASAGNTNVLVNHSTTVSSVITNSGSGTADTLNYTGLTAGATGGSISGSSTSGGPLALGASGTNTGLTYTAGATSGTFAVTPTLTGSATNGTLGGAATASGTSAVAVHVYDATSLSAALSGTNMVATNAAGANRASASVTADNGLSNNQGFTNTTVANGTQINPGSGVNVAVFDKTGKMNGTYTATKSLSFNDVTTSGSSIAGGNGDSAAINLTVTVTGQTAGAGVTLSAPVLSGQNYGTTTPGGSSSGYSSTSNIGGLHSATTATLINGTASANATISMTFYDTAAAAGAPVDNAFRSSDILSLSGLAGSQGTGPDGSTLTDTFVLQLTFDASASGPQYIGWYDSAKGQWVNAIAGNSTGSGLYSGTGEFNGSYATYLNTSTGSGGGQGLSLGAQLGAFGYDSNTDTAWAVLDHNSDFAVIPEPGTWGMILAGFGMLVAFRRFKRSGA